MSFRRLLEGALIGLFRLLRSFAKRCAESNHKVTNLFLSAARLSLLDAASYF
jgi:hypothetical protein